MPAFSADWLRRASCASIFRASIRADERLALSNWRGEFKGITYYGWDAKCSHFVALLSDFGAIIAGNGRGNDNDKDNSRSPSGMTTRKARAKAKPKGRGLAFLEGFELVEGAGPVGAEETREAAVGEDFSVGLALGAVVGFVVGVADALDGLAAGGAGLFEATVDGHVFAEGGDFFGEVAGGFGVEAIDPELKSVAGGGEEALPLLVGEFVGERDGGEAGGVEDLVGVGVADAREDARVGEGSLEGAVFGGEGGAEAFEIGGEDVDAAGVD